MPNLRRVLSGLFAAALLIASPALADWEADLQFTPRAGSMGPGPARELKGKAHGRQSQLRMDLESPRGPMSMLVNWEKHQMTLLLHSQKLAMQRDTGQDSDIPSCGIKDIEACLAAQGFKKSGSEKVNGHPCAVYEKDGVSGNGPVHTKVWRPTDLKEVPFLRSQSSDASGITNLVNLTNVKVGAQSDSLFVAPTDYRTMQAPSAGTPGAQPRGAGAPLNPADFQGKTPEQIREMIQQHTGQNGAPPADK
jgi:hypothetical protein